MQRLGVLHHHQAQRTGHTTSIGGRRWSLGRSTENESSERLHVFTKLISYVHLKIGNRLRSQLILSPVANIPDCYRSV